jgi:tetratricopeptide (TPR) repeat protein
MTGDYSPLMLLLQGKLAQAESAAHAGVAAATEQQAWETAACLLSLLASVALAQGAFAKVERTAQQAVAMGQRAAAPWAARDARLARLSAMALQGHWQAAQNTLHRLHNPVLGRAISGAVPVYQLLLRAYQSQALGESLRPLARTLLKTRTADPEWLGPLCGLVELGEASLLTELTHAPARRLAQALDSGIVMSPGWVCLLPRQLGIAATLREEWAEAEAYFQQAIEVATAAQAIPELGRTYLAYARLLRIQPDTCYDPRIAALLDNARNLFEALGMAPFVAAALSLTHPHPR